MESLMSVLGMHAYLVFKATGGILAMPLLETTPVLAKFCMLNTHCLDKNCKSDFPVWERTKSALTNQKYLPSIKRYRVY